MFENPNLLFLLIAVPLMALLFYWRGEARARALARLGDPALIAALTEAADPRTRALRSGLWLVALGCIAIALAGPVWGVDAEIIEAQGVAVVVALDVSASMDAQDLLPSRLERAKQAARDLLAEGEGNLFGLVLFAGEAFVQFPLTGDVDTAATFLDAVSTRSISRQGTAIAEALRLSLDVIDRRIAGDAVIVLLTDGENHDGDPLALARAAAEREIAVHVIGYGSPEGAIIPIYDDAGQIVDYKTDQGGNIVQTRLDEPILSEIAALSGGRYWRAGESGVEVVDLLNTIATLQGNIVERRAQTRAVPRFALFVALALLALTLERWLPEARWSSSVKSRSGMNEAKT
jgi:Ca-activated chloride channel family protein